MAVVLFASLLACFILIRPNNWLSYSLEQLEVNVTIMIGLVEIIAQLALLHFRKAPKLCSKLDVLIASQEIQHLKSSNTWQVKLRLDQIILVSKLTMRPKLYLRHIFFIQSDHIKYVLTWNSSPTRQWTNYCTIFWR